jgi:hypothetical protein
MLTESNVVSRHKHEHNWKISLWQDKINTKQKAEKLICYVKHTGTIPKNYKPVIIHENV